MGDTKVENLGDRSRLRSALQGSSCPRDLCQVLDWDSEFFGRRIARVNVSRLHDSEISLITEWCRANRVDCLYFLADADDPATAAVAQRHGFALVDVRLTLAKNLRESDLQKPGGTGVNLGSAVSTVKVRPCRSSDLPHLLPVARASHSSTRFFFDQNFPRNLCERLYEVWLQNSFEGWAQALWVAEWENLPVGYISCHLQQETGDGKIGLLGVGSSARGRGAGLALVRRALEWFAEKGVVSASVVTQARNVPAQRLYQRCGFMTSSVQLWYHKWF